MSVRSLFQQNIFWRGMFVISGLLVSIFIARSLKPELSGTVYYNISILSFVIQVSGLSLESGIGYYAAGKKIATSSLAIISLLWTLFVSAIAIGAYITFLPSFPDFDTELLRSYDVGLFIAGNLLYTYFSALFYSRLNFKIPNLVGSLINLLICFVTIYFWKFNFTGSSPIQIVRFFYFSFLIKGILVMLCYYLLREREDKSSTSLELMPLLRYSLVACIANSLAFLLYRFDYYYVELFCTPNELGNYIQVSKISQLFFMLPGMIAGVVFPLTSKSEDPIVMKATIVKLFRIIFYGTLSLCLLLAITGYWLFPLVFGEEFDKMFIPFLLMTPGIILFSALAPVSAFNAGKNKVIINIVGTVLAVVLIIISGYIFIPYFSINGAAFISSAGYIIMTFYILKTFGNQYNIRLAEYFKFDRNDFKLIRQPK
ncbi:MAG: hypothetical protein ACXWV5_12000 [Flavitalea sp.]